MRHIPSRVVRNIKFLGGKNTASSRFERPGPGLVLTDEENPIHRWYKNYETRYKEPIKDIVSLATLGKLLVAVFLYKKAAVTREVIHESQKSLQGIDETLKTHMIKMCGVVEENNRELKKLNSTATEIQKAVQEWKGKSEGRKQR